MSAERQTKDSPLQIKETIYDGISYMCPTWNEMGLFNFELAKQIISTTDSNPPFDRLVALARGGWTWARGLADALKIPELSSHRIKTYSGVNSYNEPVIIQPLADAVYGQNILLFDEVIDTGISILKAKEYLKVMGAKNIKIAALCLKPHSVIEPDFYAFKTAAWVVFPHEVREFIEESTQKWLEKGLTVKEISERLINIGIAPQEAELYLKLYLNI